MKSQINQFFFNFPVKFRIILVNCILYTKLFIKFIKTGKKSYSQFNEDLLLMSTVSETKIKYKNYLDIGCFHPKYLSNTQLLHENGWTGLGVDLSEEKVDYFISKRKPYARGLICAIVPNEDVQKFYKGFFFKKIWSEIDTLSIEVAENKRINFGYSYVEKKVQTMPINKLLKEFGPFDVMNIDIEGLDKLVLSNMDYNLAPQIIIFENSKLDMNSIEIKHLIDNGYKLKFSAHISHCFVRTEE